MRIRNLIFVLLVPLSVAGCRQGTATPEKDEALFVCVMKNDAPCVRRALKAGASPNAVDEEGRREMAAAGIDRPSMGALQLAAYQGDLEIVKILVEAGADVNQGVADGVRTPLHNAAAMNHFGIVQYLLHHGADPSSRTKDGDTPASNAFRKGHRDVYEAIKNAKEQ